MVGSILLPIGLYWFAWSARSDVHWISPVLATIPFGTGNLSVFCSYVLYIIDTYGPSAGGLRSAIIVRYCVPLTSNASLTRSLTTMGGRTLLFRLPVSQSALYPCTPASVQLQSRGIMATIDYYVTSTMTSHIRR
ncbi:hypothetical protein HRR77_003454 [Exophiala dermatitidis]|nr:hypothetical protein HRR77_003454 [Exophiala dermatitidis]